MHAVEDFPMPETYTQVCAFCGLACHYRYFIKGFTLIVWPLYHVLGKEVKMGPVQLATEVCEVVRMVRSSKLEFLALKWSVMEHFKEYLTCVPFVVRTDDKPLTYVLTTPNLDATCHGWKGLLASFEFMVEYRRGWIMGLQIP